MSEIQNFYENSTILITGGTGFLGKLLVEKLLRSCQNINKIILIMRNKNGFTTEQRMNNYFKDQIFLRLKVINPSYKTKLTVVQGDIECNNLNLSSQDEQLLINTVNIIIHTAASVNFNQKIRDSINTNLHGIRKLMELAMKMPNLKSFIHISTVYSNCQVKTIEEKIYETKTTYQEVNKLLQAYDDKDLEKMTPSLLGESPNMYIISKALAEKFISENYQHLPIGIFRPAIVVSTSKEPISGWVDNFYGPTGLVASYACGFLRVAYTDTEVFSNIVPADLVVNGILAAGWEIGMKCKKLPIYNFVSTQNPISWGEFLELSKLGLHYPFSNSIGYVSLFVTRQKWLYDIMKFILHTIPAYIIDTILRIMRKKPYVVRNYTKIHEMMEIFTPFTTRNWEYSNDNVLELWEKMSERDQKLFNFDISTLNWNVYFKHYIKGIRVYMFKDDLSNVEAARIKYRRLRWIHRFFKYSFLLFLFYHFCRRIS